MVIDKRKIIWIIVVIIVIIGAFMGLSFISSVTGNVITGGSVDTPTIEQESFKINDNVNNVEVIDGSQDNG